jgi:TatD DNase family protein
MPIRYVDFHCHADLYEDHRGLVDECEAHSTYTLAVTTTPKAWGRNNALASGSKFVRVALGLHPQLVESRPKEIELFKELLPKARYVGEVGLDGGARFFKSMSAQREVFEAVLRACASERGKVLSVHSVRAAAEVIQMVDKWLPFSHGRVVLHWFTGTKRQARQASELGCFFSINSQMLAKPQHAELVADLPLDRLLTETDGPFTTVRDRPTRPKDVREVVETLASVRGVTATDMAKCVLANMRTVLQ